MKRSDVGFLSVAQVERMHEEAILHYGAGDASPAANRAKLEAAVIAPQSALYHVGSLAELAAIVAHSIAKVHHPFVDGNKRTATFAMLVFLEGNGFPLVLPEGVWIEIMEGVADGAISRDRLAEELAAELGRRRGVAGPPMWVDFEPDDDEDTFGTMGEETDRPE